MKAPEVFAPADRLDKILDLAKRMGDLAREFLEMDWVQDREVVYRLMEELQDRLEKYRRYEITWDSHMIDVPTTINDVALRVQEISCEDSVMDKAREIFLHVQGGSHDLKRLNT